jgi:hypothetical protein
MVNGGILPKCLTLAASGQLHALAVLPLGRIPNPLISHTGVAQQPADY